MTRTNPIKDRVSRRVEGEGRRRVFLNVVSEFRRLRWVLLLIDPGQGLENTLLGEGTPPTGGVIPWFYTPPWYAHESPSVGHSYPTELTPRFDASTVGRGSSRVRHSPGGKIIKETLMFRLKGTQTVNLPDPNRCLWGDGLIYLPRPLSYFSTQGGGTSTDGGKDTMST